MSKNNINKNKVSKYITINGRYRSSKPLYNTDVFTNVFGNGGSWDQQSQQAWDKAWFSENAAGSFGSLTGGLGTIISSGFNNAELDDTTGIKNTIEDYKKAPIEMSSREGLINQWASNKGLNADFKYSDFTPSDSQRISNTFNSTLSGAMTGAQIGGPWGALAGGVIGLGSGLAGIFVGNAKARKEADKLNQQATAANMQRNMGFINAAEFLDQQDFMLNMQNYAALGGPLYNMFAEGGSLSRTHGSDFSNGVTYIKEGGTHEENPNEGVQIGVDEEGNPNLVEEGEVIFNDYVYSNRLTATKEDLAKYNLPDKYDNYTFAKIANELFKESEESPNDPISLETLKTTAGRLKALQEEIREANNIAEANKFTSGGYLRQKEDGSWEYDEDKIAEEARKKALQSATEGTTAYNSIYDGAVAAIKAHYKGALEEKQKRYSKDRAQIEEYNRIKSRLEELGYTQEAIKKMQIQLQGNNAAPQFGSEAKKIIKDNEGAVVDKPKNEGLIGPPLPDNFKRQEPTVETKQVKQEPASKNKKVTSTPKEEPLQGLMIDKGGNFVDEIEPSVITADASDWKKSIPAVPTVFDNYKAPAEEWKSNIPEVPTVFDTPNTNQETPQVESSFDWGTFGNEALRHAPVLGNIIGLFGNKKDYSDVEDFEAQTRNPRSVRFTSIGGQYDMNLVSPWEMQNPILQAAAGTRRTLANSTLGNSVAMNNAIMASDAQTQGLLGQAYLQGKEYNTKQMQAAAEFKRGIDQYNSTGSLQAQSTNMGLNDYFYNRALNRYNMRNAIDMGYTQARAANATSLFNNLGNIGKENVIWNMANNSPGLAWALMRNGNYQFKGV